MSSIELYIKLSKLLRERASVRDDRLWAIAVALVCLALAIWLATTPRTPFLLSVDLRSSSLSATFDRDWSLDRNLRAGEILLSSLEHAEAPGFGLRLQSPQRGVSLVARGDQIRMESLRARPVAGKAADEPASGRINLSIQPDGGIQMLFSEVAVDGNLRLGGTIDLRTRLEPGGSADRQILTDLVVPEPLTFSAQAVGGVPLRLRSGPLEPWSLYGIPLTAINFEQERTRGPGEIGFESTIFGGSVRLPEVGRKKKLLARDRLSLSEIRTRRMEVLVGPELRILLEGEVESARMGPEGFESDLAPSRLEYYYHREPLKFFWGAVVFLWGVLWGVKKTLLA